MKKSTIKKRIILSLVGGVLMTLTSQVLALTIHMAGDSTMSIKDPKDYPETGWGVPFATFFADDINVANYAKNGRSTRTFIEEGIWGTLINTVKPHDYVIIQFGHNDESARKKDRFTTPKQYQENLQRFINDVKTKQAYPILMSSITRRYFADNGKLKETHPYAPLVQKVALQNPDVTFIDMERLTRDYFNQLGDQASAIRFMHIKPGLHPNYPNGVRDDTHLNQMGAREVAQLVLVALRTMQHPLAAKTRPVDPKHLKLRY
ncbi:rhamnogalacturonan acetylesterase [Algibacillus agarilyticus]|uniref:rhamnogalacturonan acetylesterase n=1 Tax=Algibacillus agarilyticus TaxID=2234133 RepID=UPI000DCFD24D|nr:rhamnogalacturonan acetylesterase [Algibacillus agarilyticus]